MKYRNSEALGLVFVILLPPVAMVMTVQHTVDWDFAPYPSYYSDWATAKKFVAGERLSKNTDYLLTPNQSTFQLKFVNNLF